MKIRIHGDYHLGQVLYTGKDLVRGYARWYGVDQLCAIVELLSQVKVIDAPY